jgi:hypothetical protein
MVLYDIESNRGKDRVVELQLGLRYIYSNT